MRKCLLGLVVTVLAAALSGCFMSREPLIAADASEFPYERIVFTMAGEAGEQVLTRDGDAYALPRPDGDPLRVRFMAVEGGDVYVVQVGGPDGSGSGWLYGLLKVDEASGTVLGYKLVGSEADVRPGLAMCDDEMVCIESLDAYVQAAMESLSSGAPPDNTYEIVTAE